LICVEGYSYRECAELLDLSQAIVTNRLFQARMRLRQAMAAEEEPADISTSDDSPRRRASA